MKVTVDVVSQDEYINTLYIGYKVNRKKEYEMMGIFSKEGIETYKSEDYKNKIIESFEKESLGTMKLMASIGDTTLSDALSYSIVFIPVPSATIIKFDIKEIDENTDN